MASGQPLSLRTAILALLLLLTVDARVPHVLSHYAPKTSACPSGSLVRVAKGLSPAEGDYVKGRNKKASTALTAWAKKIDPGFGTAKPPVVALANSGGGFRAMLTGAGVVQALDGRDGKTGTNGLYQGLTYHSGLSGGGWLLSSLMGNDWPTISSLKDSLWTPKLQKGMFAAGANPRIQYDIASKKAKGAHSSLVNIYGRALSYMLLRGPHGGVDVTLSSIAETSSFKSQSVPYPIITAVQIDTASGTCSAQPTSLQFEMHPSEFGSWDPSVRGFTPTKLLGTPVDNGKPTKAGKCTSGYDQLGYIMGTSSSLFNMACSKLSQNIGLKLPKWIDGLIKKYYKNSPKEVYAAYPNPFHNYAPAAKLAKQQEINLVDGGESHQNIPIWPYLQPERQVDVLIVSDNSGEGKNKFPQGKSLSNTYTASKAAGLSKMPEVPSQADFVAKGIGKGPKFFGCKAKGKMTIIYLPNSQYSFPSGQPTFRLKYPPKDTAGMIANGVKIATKGGDPAWPMALACGVFAKSSGLPKGCGKLLKEYCYN